MGRRVSTLLTEREAEIMEVLWTRGEASAEVVREQLADEPHDSTVRTLLRVLEQKGYVRTKGRQPTLYQPRVSREVMQSRVAKSLVARFFSGSAESLVLRLIEDQEISAAKLDELRGLLKAKKNKGKKS